MTFLRRVVAAAALLLLGACAQEDLTKAPPPLGNFQLGYNVVVAKNAKTAGPTRLATPEEWQAALKPAIAERIGRYQGGKLYHLGTGVEAYALAVPGIPVVLSPKSVLVITVNVWDDTAQRIINAEPKQFTVFESLSGSTLIGSGLTQTKQQQMATLSRNAARQIDKWLNDNKAWFSPEAAAARAVLGPQAGAPDSGAPADAAAPASTPASAPAASAPAAAAPAQPTSATPPVATPPASAPKKKKILPPPPAGQTIGLP
jgi:outer membrane murein-binding lipoprotein Lpp